MNRYGISAAVVIGLAFLTSPVVGAQGAGRGIAGVVSESQGNQSESRIALVIGNSSYPDGPLRNPANDARAIGKRLGEFGFEVIERIDCPLDTMDRAIREFGQRIQGAGVALFFYAGHGLQVEGQNYLVPVDAKIEAENEIRYACINAGLVLAKMETAGARVNIVILDACRNNPFARSFRSSTQGLAVMDAAQGSFIAYSTAPGRVASDGDGRNSVYTESLLAHMGTPGQRLEQMFKRVRVDVMAKTAKRQVPWENTSLTSDFFFLPTTPSTAEVPPPPPPMVLEGHLQVNVTAPGARVVLDGRPAGEANPGNPLLCKNLPAGEVRVEVSADGYQTQVQSIQIKQDEWAQLAFELARNQEDVPANTQAPASPPTPAAPLTTAMVSPDVTPGSSPLEPEMVLVKGGTFWMGSDAIADARPVHQVTVDGFYISRHEISATQYCRFLNEIARLDVPTRQYIRLGGECTVESTGNVYRPVAGCENHPVNRVSWLGALEYTKWLTKATGKAYALPTEAQWEFAARGDDGRPYPWGDSAPSESLANFARSWRSPKDSLAPVTSYSAGATPGTGIHHLAGNVQEWCRDAYDRSYYKMSPQQNPCYASTGTNLRVLRGGDCLSGADYVQAARRYGKAKQETNGNFGFRVVLGN